MNKKESLAVQVPKERGEQVRRMLLDQGVLRSNYQIIKNKQFLYLPVLSIAKDMVSFPLVNKEFIVRERKVHSYKELLDLSDEEKQLLPTSFDVIGSILLIKIPSVFWDMKETIGQALLDSMRHVETVCAVEPVNGELRIRNVRFIAGKHNTTTVHTEYGLSFTVDVKRTYFSPRLANERYRIAHAVQAGECILDLFTGVAPFPVMIARKSNPYHVIGIDKNEDACQLAQRNIMQNRVHDIIDIIHADAMLCDRYLKRETGFDRIIMNLPFRSYDFFGHALQLIAHRTIIHFYEIMQEDGIGTRIESLKSVAEAFGIDISSVKTRVIKSYAPREFYICLDITAENI